MSEHQDVGDRVRSSTRGLQLSSEGRERHAAALRVALNGADDAAGPLRKQLRPARSAVLAAAVLFVGGLGFAATSRAEGESVLLTGPAAPVTAPEETPTTTTSSSIQRADTSIAGESPQSTFAAVTTAKASVALAISSSVPRTNVIPVAPTSTTLLTQTTQLAQTTQVAQTTLSTSTTVSTQTTLSNQTTQPAEQTTTSQTNPTTSATQPVGLELYLMNRGTGDTRSSKSLPLALGRPSNPLANYDDDRDDALGILVQKDGAGLSSNDSTKYQEWQWTFDEAQELTGPVSLTVWAASKDFKTDEQVGIAAELSLCASSCSTVGTGTWSGSGTQDWRKVTIDLVSIDTIAASGSTLRIRIATPDNRATNDSIIAFGAAANPAVLSIG